MAALGYSILSPAGPRRECRGSVGVGRPCAGAGHAVRRVDPDTRALRMLLRDDVAESRELPLRPSSTAGGAMTDLNRREALQRIGTAVVGMTMGAVGGAG